jgi:hypothetical protein
VKQLGGVSKYWYYLQHNSKNLTELGVLGCSILAMLCTLWPPRSLRSAQVLSFKKYLDSKPGVYLEEMRNFWYDEFDIQVNVLTVYQQLEVIRWSRKLATKQAKEQSEALRHVYLA